MTKTELFNKVSRTFHKAGFQLKKHSPEILVIAGVTGTVVSAVMACKATTKLDAVLKNAKIETEAVNNAKEEGEVGIPNEETGEVELVPYTEEDYKKDIVAVRVRHGLELVKLYAPSVVLGAASITCILAGHKILNKRNVALAAAYATVDNSFKEYRDRVIDRFGEELDRELRYNIKAQEVETVVTNEDGTESIVKETVETVNPGFGSEYAFFFDECSSQWTKDPEYNKMFLVNVEREANRKLQREGQLFLNDLHKMLGVDATKAGQVVGWLYDPENHPEWDNYINLHIFDVTNEQKRMFVNGKERNILIDPNVQGEIWHMMKDRDGLNFRRV